ncbi:hypothetical protein V7S57_11860 [Caulobacter sp. CCNWLY153]|jgi:hypothetical protein|nr:hypothetical protein [Caulobacter radicis]
MSLTELIPIVVAAAIGPGGALVVALAALGVVALAISKIPGGGPR